MNPISSRNSAIIYCRLSRVPDADRGILSLDSQEYAIKEFITKLGLGIYSVLKNIGSAYKLPQTELKNYISSCKNKVLCVADPSRLSRNITNFNNIWNICKKNGHKIGIATMDKVYDPNGEVDYIELLELIRNAERESFEMGRKISRTAQYKKSLEPDWGFKRREYDGKLVPNIEENEVSKLIKLLNTSGSSISQINKLVNKYGKMEGKDPFEIVECEKVWNEVTKLYEQKLVDISDKLPYGMDIPNIEETLKIYEIRKRKARWTRNDIWKVIRDHNIDVNKEEELSDSFSVMSVNTNVEVEEKKVEWISIYYDPKYGLPPNVTIPEGITLPINPGYIMIPKV